MSRIGIYDSAMLLALSPLTPLHVGVGRVGGVVDMPVQRDGFGFPIIYSSSLKGAFKSHVSYTVNLDSAKCLFGPEPDEEEKFSSPVSFTDAVLALVPCRASMRSPLLVTGRLALNRVLDYIDLIGEKEGGKIQELKKIAEFLVKESEKISQGKILLLNKENAVKVGGGLSVFIAGDRYDVEVVDKPDGLKFNVIGELLINSFRDFVPGRIAVAGDDDFRRIVEKSLIRLTRVRLNRKTKTAQSGGLWTEEYVPQGSLFLAVVLSSEKRADNCKQNFKESLDKLKDERYIVLGGKESIGKGIVKTTFLE